MAEGQQVASLYAKLGADITELKRGLAEAQSGLAKTAGEAEKTNRKVAESFSHAGDTLGTYGRRLTLGLTVPIVAAGGAFVKAAADAVESENLFEISMGGMAKSARDWSEDISESLRLNAYEVRKQVGTWDVMIKNMGVAEEQAFDMSKQLTVLAQDMASFYNMSPEEAFQKLQSGIAGEIEPLRRLGISLDAASVEAYALEHGLAKAGEEMTAQQKIVARYALILEQTSTAQGDLARTIDSPTNKLRALKAQAEETQIAIGTKLLPVMVAGLDAADRALGEVTKRWNEMGDEGQSALLIIAGGLALGGPLLMGLGAMAGAVANIIRLTQLLQTTSIASFGAMGTAATVAATAVAGLAAAYVAAQVAFPAFEKMAYGEDLSGLTFDQWNASRAYNNVAPGSYDEYAAYMQARGGKPSPRPGTDPGSSRAYADGGWINEPVVGYGTRSGQSYLLGEGGSEYVSPSGPAGGMTLNAPIIGTVIVQNEADEDRLAAKIQQALLRAWNSASATGTRAPVAI